MPIPIENSQKPRRGRGRKLSKDVEDVQNDFREKLSLDEVPRLRRKTKVMKKQDEDPHAFSVRSSRKPSDKVSPSQKKPIVAKSKESMKDIKFRSVGKLSSDKASPSQKKPVIKKSKEDIKDIEFGFGVEQPTNAIKRKADTTDSFVWSDDDMEEVDLGVIEKSDLDAAMERNEDPDYLYFRLSEELRTDSLNYATAAILYMHGKGHNLELVKTCMFEVGEISNGFRVHFNFKAKNVDDPNSPLETFFCQLCDYGGPITVECCVSLGKSDSLPWKRDNRGCQYCTKHVHHPVSGCKGIKWGRCRWSEKRNRFIVT